MVCWISFAGLLLPASQNNADPQAEIPGIDADKCVSIKYSGGAECSPMSGGTAQRQAEVDVVCDSFTSLTAVAISPDQCNAYVTIASPAGCGTIAPPEPSGLIGGVDVALVILILFAASCFCCQSRGAHGSCDGNEMHRLVVAVVLYFGIGMLVGWRVKHAETVAEMIPNHTFWTSLPGLVRDGAKFVVSCGRKHDYDSV